MEKKETKNEINFFRKIGASFRNRTFRFGAYAALSGILVVAAVIAVNLLVAAAGIRKDLTADGQKSLTKETKELLDGLENDLTIYYLTRGDQPMAFFDMYIELYQRASKKIEFKTVDLLLQPKFAETYTDEKVIPCSMIVVDKKTNRSKYISSTDMVIEKTVITENGYDTEPSALDIEGRINGAIHYVTSGEQTKLYAVAGHGEKALGEEAKNILRKSNIQYDTFESLTMGDIPQDCDVLFISNPSTDYSNEELALFEAYAQKGGNFLINAVYQEGMDNFNKLLAEYGLQLGNGVIVEGDSKRHSASSPLAVFPEIRTEHKITSAFPTGKYFPAPYSGMITVDNQQKTREVSVLFSSSAKSFLKEMKNGTLELTKKAGDKEGPFTVGIYVKDLQNQSEAVVIANKDAFLDGYLQTDNFVNASLLTNSVQYMAGAEGASAIRMISLEGEEMLTLNASEAYAITITFAVVIPVLLILVGIVIMLRRKNK